MGETIELVYIKIGGSFITFKEKPFSINYVALENLVKILYRVVDYTRLVLGNGGGSFAHYVVDRYRDSDPCKLIALCQNATRKLNHFITSYLVEHGLNAVSVQTSSILIKTDSGYALFPEPVVEALRLSLIPVVYGECIYSREKGYEVVSTERVFEMLSEYIKPKRIVLLTDVDGVYTCDPRRCSEASLIKIINNDNYMDILEKLKEISGRDATGSIYGKILSMTGLSRRLGVKIYIVSGFNVSDVVKAVSGEDIDRGTIIDMTT